MPELHCPTCGTPVSDDPPRPGAAAAPPPGAAWASVRSGLLAVCWGMGIHAAGEAVLAAYLILAAAGGSLHGAVFAHATASLARLVGGALALVGIGMACGAPREAGAGRSGRVAVGCLIAAAALALAAAWLASGRAPPPGWGPERRAYSAVLALAGTVASAAVGVVFFGRALRAIANFIGDARLGARLFVSSFAAWVVALAGGLVPTFLYFAGFQTGPLAGMTAQEWAAVAPSALTPILYGWLAVLLLSLRRRLPPAPAPAAPRFSWPMRIFLTLLVFEIVFRSACVLVPWKDWESGLQMEYQYDPDDGGYTWQPWPRRPPTRAEAADLAAAASPDRPYPVADRFGESLDSLARFLSPWPTERTLAAGNSPDDLGKYVLTWLNRRMSFGESLIALDERWVMFSPGASKEKDLTRARLVFADGAEEVVRQHADPEDLTWYFRWNQEKVLDYEMQAKDDASHAEECAGYCNVVAHQHPHNAAGAPLAAIYLFRVHYDYPPPQTSDFREYLRERSGPPRYVRELRSGAATAVGLAAPLAGPEPWLTVAPLVAETGWVGPDFYRFDAAEGTGRYLR